MKRGSNFEQIMSDDELLDNYTRILALEMDDLEYWQMIRDHTRELIYRDLLVFAVCDE